MKLTFARAANAAAFVFAAPLLTVSALADEPGENAPVAPAETVSATDEAAPEQPVQPAQAEVPVEAAETPIEPEQPTAPAAVEEPEEERVICRSIRLDASSRRKTRVCRTAEGWRQLNQRR